MPPKSGRRRAPRATARKSTPVVIDSPADPESTSSSHNDTAFDSEPPRPPPSTDLAAAINTATEPPPSTDLTSSFNDAALAAEPDTGNPTDQTAVEPENTADVVVEDTNPKIDVVLGSSSEALDQPEEPLSEANDGGRDEVACSETVNGESEKGNESGKGKKAKKVVKKVVKKVIRKVPKKVVKGESEEIPNPNSTNLKVLEVAEGEKKVEVDKKENNLNGSIMEVDDDDDEKEKVVKGESEEIPNPNSTNSKVLEVDEGEKKVEVDEKEKNVSGLMESDNDDDEKEKEVKFNENNEERNGEEEMREGKLFSGEMEAMERKKRRKTEVFIGGLDKDATEEDVRKVFAAAGEIVDLRVVMNSKTGKNKGFAFLRYASASHAKKALEMFAKVEVCGKQCGATPVEGNDTLYLGNIDKKWKDEDVLKLLQEIGVEYIDKVTVMIDPNKSEHNRGFAFVEFETSKDAQNAYKKLQKKDAFGNHNVKIAWAEPLNELDEEEMLKVKTVYAEFIPSSWDEEKVREMFKKFGEIDDVVLARNLRTTKRKDFAFISYKTREDAVKCIESFSRELNEEGMKVNVKVSLAKPMQKGRKTKPVVRSATKEAPNKKQKNSHVLSRPSDMRYMVQPMVPHYDAHMSRRSSEDAELVHMLRERATWRQSHASLSNGPVDVQYPYPLPGRKRQFSMLEADPLYPDFSRYPYSRLDASLPVPSSSHNVLHPSGRSSTMAYQQQHSGYPSGSAYGTRNYPSNFEFRDRAPGSGSLYRRY